MKIIFKQSSNPRTLYTSYFISLFNIFWASIFISILPCKMKFLCILYIRSIVLLWSLVIKKRCTTLEIARDLNTVILLSKVNNLMHHNFRILSILRICSEKFLSCSRFLLYEKWTPSIFTVSLLRLTHFMPRSATWTPFRTEIPAI